MSLWSGTDCPTDSHKRHSVAIALGPCSSHLGAVLPVMDDIPGDERATNRRHEHEGDERRQLERRRDERQHGDARREPARPDPSWSLGRRAADEVDQPQTQADVGEEIEREPTAERHGGHGVQGLCRRARSSS